MKHKIDIDKIDRKAFRNVANENVNEADELDNDELVEILDDFVPEQFNSIPGMTKEKGLKLSLQFIIAKLGVTPEEYSMLYDLFQDVYPNDGKGKSTDKFPLEELLDMQTDSREPQQDYSDSFMKASGMTLVLKVQLKGIVKPPMWREVEVPANYTFEDLHDVIQQLTGLCNMHMWEFHNQAHNSNLCISKRINDPYGYLSEHISYDAYKTPLIDFLASKGDTLEYVYDFGDYWVFKVTVLKVLDKKSEKPVCTKYKSEFNAFEDLGGPYVYNELRAFADPDSEMTDEERKQLENEYGSFFDSKKSFKIWIESNKFDIEKVNEILAGIY